MIKSGVKIESIREVVRAQPFRPFWIYPWDGGRIQWSMRTSLRFSPPGVK